VLKLIQNKYLNWRNGPTGFLPHFVSKKEPNMTSLMIFQQMSPILIYCLKMLLYQLFWFHKINLN